MQKLIYDAAFPFSILGENGELVAYCDDDGLSKTEREYIARRLVVCFNACAGITTDLLEKDVNGQIVHMRETMQLERFAALVAAAKKEECAKVCDNMAELVDEENTPIASDQSRLIDDCAAAIRALYPIIGRDYGCVRKGNLPTNH